MYLYFILKLSLIFLVLLEVSWFEQENTPPSKVIDAR
jgi:hypothetical protein